MLKEGNLIPDISLKDDEGETVRLHDYIGQSPLVIYFYPKDDTPGCTIEACGFRDYNDDFQEVGAKVFGISGDSEESHRKFKKKYRLNFSLLSDIHRKAEKAFGVKRNLLGLLPGRVTFVTDLEGRIILVFDSALNPRKHVQEALNKLRGSIKKNTATHSS